MIKEDYTTKKVLIVEDYDDTRQLMRLWIEMDGYRAIEASDGVEAIGCVKNECPDLILMDINLPVMDGIAATRAIRHLESGKDIPVIAITAYGAMHEQALEAGCNHVVGKPIDFENVLHVISGYFPKV